MDAIREAETPIFEESAIESRQVITVIRVMFTLHNTL